MKPVLSKSFQSFLLVLALYVGVIALTYVFAYSFATVLGLWQPVYATTGYPGKIIGYKLSPAYAPYAIIAAIVVVGLAAVSVILRQYKEKQDKP